MSEKDFLPIGKIVSAHGIKGALKFRAYGETAEIEPERKISLKDASGSMKTYKVEWARASQKAFVLLGLKGVNDRNAAESLRIQPHPI